MVPRNAKNITKIKRNCIGKVDNSEFYTNPSFWTMLRVDKSKIQLLNVVQII